ncbi:hypothetical protein Droror1_Dr00011796 [Drosera rotundifolia]
MIHSCKQKPTSDLQSHDQILHNLIPISRSEQNQHHNESTNNRSEQNQQVNSVNRGPQTPQISIKTQDLDNRGPQTPQISPKSTQSSPNRVPTRSNCKIRVSQSWGKSSEIGDEIREKLTC